MFSTSSQNSIAPPPPPKKTGLLFQKTLEQLQKEEASGVDLLNENQIPHMLVACDKFLRENVDFEGILRSPGGSINYNILKEAYDRGENPSLTHVEVEVVSSIFKFFFRELPTSILPIEIFTEQFKVHDDEVFKNTMAKHLVKMSDWYRKLLAFIMDLFEFIMDHEEENKMTPIAIAVSVRPSILRTDEREAYYRSLDVAIVGTTLAADSEHGNRVIAKMIEHFKTINAAANVLEEENKKKKEREEIVQSDTSKSVVLEPGTEAVPSEIITPIAVL